MAHFVEKQQHKKVEYIFFLRRGRRKRWVEHQKRAEVQGATPSQPSTSERHYATGGLLVAALYQFCLTRRDSEVIRARRQCWGCVSTAGAAQRPCCFSARDGDRGTTTSSAKRTNWTTVTLRNHRRVAWWKRSVCEGENVLLTRRLTQNEDILTRF